MLKWAFVFLLVSIVASALGYTGVAAASAGIAKALFVVCFAIFAVLLILGLTVASRIRNAGGGSKEIR